MRGPPLCALWFPVLAPLREPSSYPAILFSRKWARDWLIKNRRGDLERRLSAESAPLAGRFIKQYPGGHGHVQTFHISLHGDPN